MKKIFGIILASLIFLGCRTVGVAAAEYTGEVNAESCILMEAATGRILYEKNADASLPPASVTKVMTMLLVFEAIEAGVFGYDDMVTVSENAASMGGTQIFLEPGEQMCVDELLKSMIVSSANDAATALAEFVSGSEEGFVALMNERAKELGLTGTNFENANGLDDTAQNHVTSARDIAVMTREVLKYGRATEYSSIWMDTVRDGQFGLSNTNRLIRFYKGATGLKTGSTSKAKFCISATATRDGMTLICVIMASPTRDTRNALATSLLDFGYANYSLYENPGSSVGSVSVSGGKTDTVTAVAEHFAAVTERGKAKSVTYDVSLPEYVEAPIVQGQKIGTMTYILDGKAIGSTDILAGESVGKADFFTLFARMFSWIFSAPEAK